LPAHTLQQWHGSPGAGTNSASTQRREGGHLGGNRRFPPGRNSASRWRFRPPLPLAFRFRVRPSGSASTYRRSVLAAVGKLVGTAGSGKARL